MNANAVSIRAGDQNVMPQVLLLLMHRASGHAELLPLHPLATGICPKFPVGFTAMRLQHRP